MTVAASNKISILHWSSDDFNQFLSQITSHQNVTISLETQQSIVQQLKEQEEELQSIPKGPQILGVYPANPATSYFFVQRHQWLEAYNKLEFWATLPGGVPYLASRQGQQSPEELSSEFAAWLQSQPELLRLASLRLSNRKMTRIPPEIGLFTRLEVLEINHMPIRSLPPHIGALTLLRQFSLHHTQVRSLPTEFEKLWRLEQVVLLDNELKNIDPLSSLSRLVNLTARRNKITQLPSRLRWGQLKTLDLSNNLIEELPSSFYQCTALTCAILRVNRIHSISKQIAKLPLLECLCLNENRLSSIPSSIAQMPKLTSLNVADNQLTYLPEELRTMSTLTEVCVKNNQIAARPEFLPDKVWTDIGKLRTL